MRSIRVFQLASDLGVSSQEIIDRLKKLGAGVKMDSSSVDEDTADKVKRLFKLDTLAKGKRRFYGSDADDAEREQEEQQLRARIQVEREARENAAAAAKAAAEARKARKPRLTKADKEAEAKAAKAAKEPPPALSDAPGPPRLAPRVVALPPPVEAVEEEAPEAVEDAAAGSAAKPATEAARPVRPVPSPRLAIPGSSSRAPIVPARDDKQRIIARVRESQARVRDFPQDPDGWFELGQAYFLRGSTIRAQEALREATRLRPRFPEAWLVLARVYRAEGDMGRAAEAERQADACVD